ncbi:MAG: outer membrane lipoprotein-sorting protein [Bacteroidales bacterium]
MKTTRSLITAMVLILWMVPGILNAQDLTGKEIMEKVYYRDEGDDQKAELSMTLINSRGNERVRELEQFYKDYGEEEKKIMFFISPADVRNTSFMNWSYDDPTKDDDQWIYLPALKKVKRISSDNKDDYFMGSDFTYDDLGERHPDEDKHELLRTETLNGEECYVVESTPKESDYMYSKTVTWVIKDKWIGLKKEFYDDDGDFLKTLMVKEYDKVQGFWTILHTEMENDQKDHKTIMKFEDLEINTGISDSYFTERMMSRGI